MTGDLRVLPYIRMVSEILRRRKVAATAAIRCQPDPLERKQDYFEFSDNGAGDQAYYRKRPHCSAGRQSRPYVLPDRNLVGERDRTLQNLYDQT